MKHIAKTIKSLIDSNIYKNLKNRNVGAEATLEDVLNKWSYDLYKRKPGSAYTEDGIFQGTDLDMACLLFELSKRKAVISIPHYKPLVGSATYAVNEAYKKGPRYGNLTRLVSNADLFRFSVQIVDNSVVNIDTGEEGAPRNFSITDEKGELYDGWDKIQFDPTAKENEFIKEHGISDYIGNIPMKFFVSPNRKNSMFGKNYLLLKVAIKRVEEELKFLKASRDYLIECGINIPSEFITSPIEYASSDGERVSKQFDAYNVDVLFPEDASSFAEYPINDKSLSSIYRRIKAFNKYIIELRFFARSVEFAYSKYGEQKIPHWIEEGKWEEGFKMPESFTFNTNFYKKFKDTGELSSREYLTLKMLNGRTFRDVKVLEETLKNNPSLYNLVRPKIKFSKGRTAFDRLVLFQPEVGKHGVSLLARSFVKSERVRA